MDPFFESGPVLGRKVANIGFLGALLTADPFDEYHFFLAGGGNQKSVHDFIERNFPDISSAGRVKIMDRRDLPDAIAAQEYFCFHQSDCILYPPHLARVRNRFARNIFPITGTTHSLSYSNYGSSFLNYLWQGTTPRDCIVATSAPGAEVVGNYLDHLRQAYGLDEKIFPSPRIRTIPLGINPEAMTAPVKEQKLCARNNLGLHDERVNILVFGRIAHYSKMDILPLLRAMQRLFASGTDRDMVRVILAGWMDEEDDFPATLTQLAENMGLEISIVARPTEQIKLDLYRAADIFVSIADNPQETFGLTILEAGAMGLPVVASEYDGYRDLIVHGETGLLIETLGTATTPELDIMAPLCFDNQYHLLMAQQTAVLTPKLASALNRLIENPELRAKMGRAAALRINEYFTWPKIIRRYVKLWEELNTAPIDIDLLRDKIHPTHVRFGETFAHYTTSTILADTTVVTGITGRAIYHGREFPLIYQGLERILDQELIRKMAFFARKPIRADELGKKMKTLKTDISESDIRFHILWCIKHDILEKAC